MKEFIIKCLVVTACVLIVCACAKPIDFKIIHITEGGFEIKHRTPSRCEIEHHTPSYGARVKLN